MERFDNFMEQYLEIAKEGMILVFEGIRQVMRNTSWLIFGSLLVVILFPFWLIGKREREKPIVFHTPFPELNEALGKFAEILRQINK